MTDPIKISRRTVLAGVPAAALLTVAKGQVAAPPARPRVAILATEYRKLSHAEVIVDRFLEGFGWEGEHHHPRVDVVSLYVDQFPAGADLSRERASRFPQMKMYPTIADALTCGGPALAVDGVVIIGEHGNYPRNEKGQVLYPRYEFFKQTVDVFRKSNRSVPVFNDKHLSWNWDWAREMADTAKSIGFPLMSASSVPLTYRLPSIEMPLGAEVEEAMSIGPGPVDSYDFHVLETIQCFVERRMGGALLSFYSCGTVGVTVNGELSTFTGSFLLPFTSRAKGNVGLEDLTPPTITCPYSATGNATNVECNALSGGQHGAYVSFPDPTATDNCDTNITFVYSPPSGSFFPLNDGDMFTNYTATLTATDSSGNQSTCSFTVTIKDTEAPLFDDNENPLIEPCAIDRLTFSNDVGKCYATVILMKPTASDCCSLSVNISVSAVDEHNVVIPLCDLGNGMLRGQFPVSHDGGSNWVTVVADDGRGNTSQSRCPVIVKDTEAPVINCQDIVIVATNCTTVCKPVMCSPWHCTMKNGHHASNCSPDRYGHCHQKAGKIVYDDDRGCGIRGGSWLRRKCNKFGHWWCDKDEDDCEPATGIVVPIPTVSDNCDDEVDVSVNPPAGTPLGVGVNTITVTAVDDSGNSSTCTFKVTVLSGIKVVFTGCDLDDDNKPDNIETDADIRNRFDVCDKIPHCVKLYDICTGQDVTTTLKSSVTVVLDVTERSGSYTDSVLYKEIDENPSTAADDGTKMAYCNGQFCYTLSTKNYEKNTLNNNHFFRSDVRVYYNAYPSILAGREDVSLESTCYTSCYCY